MLSTVAVISGPTLRGPGKFGCNTTMTLLSVAVLCLLVSDVSGHSVDTEPNPPILTHPPRDCNEIQAAGVTASGRYAVYPDDNEDPLFVYCDMVTDGGGWTRRQDGSVNFYLRWRDYKYGFGSVMGEHWLGNAKIHRLTSQKTNELRVDLKDFEGNTRYAEYNQFLVTAGTLKYQLIIGDYNGNAGDSLARNNGQRFTTRDWDLDQHSQANCALDYRGGWWYNACHYSNLNGLYLRGRTTHARGVVWKTWKCWYYSMKESEMKIRPINRYNT